MITLESLGTCFEGLIPAVVATCAQDGTPNVSYVSQVYYVDPKHVAISFQFFNKTRRNVQENPFASVTMHDPITFNAYRLQLRYVRSETVGPVFDRMALQLQTIASYTGMTDVFALRAADVYEVLDIEWIEGLTHAKPVQLPADAFASQRDLDSLFVISERVARADTLGELLDVFLLQLEQRFGFAHSMLVMPDEPGSPRLQMIATRGYAENGVGSELRVGEGAIGMAAQSRRSIRISGIGQSLRYARTVRETTGRTEGCAPFGQEIPLPGLPGAMSQLAVPLIARCELVGVLAIESAIPGAFQIREEAMLSIVGNQLATAIRNLRRDALDPGEEIAVVEVPLQAAAPAKAITSPARTREVTFIGGGEDCVLVDGEYLIRNVPGRILWRLLQRVTREGRSEFTNRELRMDSWLGLPEFKDNLESRLILLRKRLEQKCPDIRIVQRGRGRFGVELDCVVRLVEAKPS